MAIAGWKQLALHIIQPHRIQLHMEPLVIQSLGYDLALSEGITESLYLQLDFACV